MATFFAHEADDIVESKWNYNNNKQTAKRSEKRPKKRLRLYTVNGNEMARRHEHKRQPNHSHHRRHQHHKQNVRVREWKCYIEKYTMLQNKMNIYLIYYLDSASCTHLFLTVFIISPFFLSLSSFFSSPVARFIQRCSWCRLYQREVNELSLCLSLGRSESFYLTCTK